MTRGRGDLFRAVLAVMVPGVVLSTPQITEKLPSVSRQLVGVVLCRCQKKGLVRRMDAEPGTQTGTRPGTWMATGAPYIVGKGGGQPQPTKPHSRYRPTAKPPQKPAQAVLRVIIRDCHAKPAPVTIRAMTSAEWEAQGGRVERLPGPSYDRPRLNPARSAWRGARP